MLHHDIVEEPQSIRLAALFLLLVGLCLLSAGLRLLVYKEKVVG
jgi:hypothetical protein